MNFMLFAYFLENHFQSSFFVHERAVRLFTKAFGQPGCDFFLLYFLIFPKIKTELNEKNCFIFASHSFHNEKEEIKQWYHLIIN